MVCATIIQLWLSVFSRSIVWPIYLGLLYVIQPVSSLLVEIRLLQYCLTVISYIVSFASLYFWLRKPPLGCLGWCYDDVPVLSSLHGSPQPVHRMSTSTVVYSPSGIQATFHLIHKCSGMYYGAWWSIESCYSKQQGSRLSVCSKSRSGNVVCIIVYQRVF